MKKFTRHSYFDLSYLEVTEYLQQQKQKICCAKKLTIAVLRNITVDPIVPYLEYLTVQLGFDPVIKMGEYDIIIQETLDSSKGIFDKNTDVILIFDYLEKCSSLLTRQFVSHTDGEIKNEGERILQEVQTIVDGIRRQTNALILFQSFEFPAYPLLGIVDRRYERSQYDTINRLNADIDQLLRMAGNAFIIDLNRCLMRVGMQHFYDLRYWHIGRAPYSREAYKEIAFENFKYIRAVKGKAKKCLVLDCDDILWGGIVGEDGLEGIKLGQTYPGSSYYEFQQEILNLYHRGVILALCSKNNGNDVWEVFEKHPDMLLKREHFSTSQINWDDKATNIQHIAKDLNIGLDSIVFIDDNEFEIGLVEKMLSDVVCFLFSKDKAVCYRTLLASCGLFDTLSLSQEDQKRGEMYRAEAERKKLMKSIDKIDDYLRTLEIEITINYADIHSIPRIAQLTQRTNQFNLTTKRYTNADIQNFIDTQESDVIYIHVKDKLGDSGIVGVAILTYMENAVNIDTLLLSCRILGRKIEDVFLHAIVAVAAKKGKNPVLGTYIPTAKNMQVRTFYQEKGFDIVEETPEHIVAEFKVNNFKLPKQTIFKKIDTNCY